MSKGIPSRSFRHAVLGAILAAFVLPSLWAHPRPFPHRHRRRHRHGVAVIVVGKPRPIRHVVHVGGRPVGFLDLNIKPKATEVWVDGRFRGIVDDFDGHPQKLRLLAGPHHVKLVTPSGLVVHRDVHVAAGMEMDVGLNLND